MVRRIVALRRRQRLGPVQIAGQLGITASTVRSLPDQPAHPHRPRHRPTTTPLRTRPSRFVDPRRCHQVRRHPRLRRLALRRQTTKATRNREATAKRTGQRHAHYEAHYEPAVGTAVPHTAIDDHSRVVYIEIHADKKAATAIGVLHRALTWFTDHGVTVERVLSANGSCYRSHACTTLGIRHKRTRPYRPQTNGKIERFHRTLAEG